MTLLSRSAKKRQIERLREKRNELIDRFIGECDAINSEIRYWKSRKSFTYKQIKEMEKKYETKR